ncbi:MAG: hypothetical protein QOH71_1959 [Blastocatellia bacterium]|nr:hypothetical protein [Blastocatellia bacterium]
MSKQIDDLKKRSGLPDEAFAKAADQIRVRTERFRQLYANNMQVGISSWDLAITFGEIIGEKEGKPIIEETVRVNMTREIAKVLSIILKNHIDAFEAAYGEIKIPIEPVAPEGAAGIAAQAENQVESQLDKPPAG